MELGGRGRRIPSTPHSPRTRAVWLLDFAHLSPDELSEQRNSERIFPVSIPVNQSGLNERIQQLVYVAIAERFVQFLFRSADDLLNGELCIAVRQTGHNRKQIPLSIRSPWACQGSPR